MAFSPIALTAAQQRNVFNLQDIDDYQARTQKHLSTGRDVNDVTDGVFDYFRARSLSDRAEEFEEYNNGVDQAISLILASTDGLESLEKLLKQWKAILNEVVSTTSSSDVLPQLATLTRQFHEAGIQMMTLMRDTHYNGVNLLDNHTGHFYVRFSDQRAARLRLDAANILGSTRSVGGLFSLAGGNLILVQSMLDEPNVNNLADSAKSLFVRMSTFFDFANGGTATGATNFGSLIFGSGNIVSNKSVVLTMLEQVNTALRRTRDRGKELGLSISLLQTRLGYNKAEVRDFSIGSDKLTLADMNQEGAFLVALNTRQQLSINALAISGRQQAAVVSLLQ